MFRPVFPAGTGGGLYEMAQIPKTLVSAGGACPIFPCRTVCCHIAIFVGKPAFVPNGLRAGICGRDGCHSDFDVSAGHMLFSVSA